jgi:hypothetical protein
MMNVLFSDYPKATRTKRFIFSFYDAMGAVLWKLRHSCRVPWRRRAFFHITFNKRQLYPTLPLPQSYSNSLSIWIFFMRPYH